MVYDEVTYIALEAHVEERLGEIVVHNSCALLCKRGETKKYVQAFVVFDDDQRAMLEQSCLEHWFGDVVHSTVFVCNRGGVRGWILPVGCGGLWLLCCGASNTLMGPFHVVFCGGWAWFEVARYSCG